MDLLLLLLAVVVGLPSLLYPWSGDFGLFDYVAGTVWHGGVPYRDAFDTKPVGMLPIIWLSQTIFGDQIWSIRLMELGAIVILGGAVARAYSYICDDKEAHLWGFSALMASSYYFFSFNFWNTSQLELWIGLFLIYSLCLLFKPGENPWSWLLAGILSGWAFLIKFPACIPTAAILALRLVYARNEASRGRLPQFFRLFFWHSAGVAIAISAMAGPLVLVLGAAYVGEMYFVFLPYYARTPLFNFRYYTFPLMNWGPNLALATLLLLGCFKVLRGQKYGKIWQLAAILVLIASTFAQVAAQQKFFAYHFGSMLPFLALLSVWSAAQIRTVIPMWATAICVTVFCSITGHATGPYYKLIRSVANDAPIDRDQFFTSPPFGRIVLLKEIAARLNQLKTSGSSLCAAPLDASYLYKLTDLRCSSPFFYAGPLRLAEQFDREKPEEQKLHWVEVDRDKLNASPPTFIVTRNGGIPEESFPRNRLRKQSYSVVLSNQDYVLFQRMQ